MNLGDDADTTGAVYGQLAGAYYGEGGIPPEWRERLVMRNRIASLAEEVHAAAYPCGLDPGEENSQRSRDHV